MHDHRMWQYQKNQWNNNWDQSSGQTELKSANGSEYLCSIVETNATVEFCRESPELLYAHFTPGRVAEDGRRYFHVARIIASGSK